MARIGLGCQAAVVLELLYGRQKPKVCEKFSKFTIQSIESTVTKLQNLGLPIVRIESNILNHMFANKEIVEKDLGHFFITSSSSRFLNKTDFELYFFTMIQ